MNPSFVFMIKLRETGGHFSASGSRSSYDDKRTRCLDIIILPIAVITDDERHIGRIAGNNIMNIYRDVHFFQSVFKQKGAFLSGELSDRHTPDIKSLIPVRLDQTENVRVIGDPEIAAYFVFFNVYCTYDDDDLSLAAELFEETQFAVGSKTRQHAGGVIVVKKLSSEFQI